MRNRDDEYESGAELRSIGRAPDGLTLEQRHMQEMARLDAKIAEAEASTAALKQMVDELNHEVASLKASLDACSQERDELHDELSAERNRRAL